MLRTPELLRIEILTRIQIFLKASSLLKPIYISRHLCFPKLCFVALVIKISNNLGIIPGTFWARKLLDITTNTIIIEGNHVNFLAFEYYSRGDFLISTEILCALNWLKKTIIQSKSIVGKKERERTLSFGQKNSKD